MIAGLLILSQVAPAENWINYASDVKNQDYDFDGTSITHHDNQGRVLVVWHRQIQNRNLVTISRTEFHCASLSYRTVYELKFEDTELVLESHREQQPWSYAVPGGLEWRLLNLTCHEYR